MKTIRKRFKKGTAVALTAALLAGLVSALPGAAGSVKAADGTTTSPSVSVYATKDQMMDGTFAPNSSGEATNIGKLIFGKNSSDEAQEWYILGKDKGVSGDNTILFAASPIARGQMFNNDRQNNKTYNASYGVYTSNPTDVYPNHYGASELRAALQNMATNGSYFTTAEQGLMNNTTVKTKDTKNNVTYTTTDKLYALAADGYGSSYKTIKAGSDNSTVLAMSNYWSSGDWFWLRSPYDPSYSGSKDHALDALPGGCVGYEYLNIGIVVQPASNLDLSSVLFASAATAASSDTAVAKTIASGEAMTLRLDGTGKDIGTVTYNTATGDIKAVKDSTAQPVSLVVQGNDGTNDWYYSKKIGASEKIKTSEIKSALSLTSDIDLSACKIWLEITEDNVSYAVNAEKEIERHVHCVCGTEDANSSEHVHKDVTWTPVSDLNEITKPGNYYLTQDIEMEETWEPKSGVVLCLNGHSISNTYKDNLRPNDEKATIQINSGKFTLTDCSRDENGQNKGSVTHANGSRGTGVTFFNTNTSFDMYGGNIRGNYAVHHRPRWNGAGVYVSLSGCHFTMYGGSISDNQGHGVSVVEGATFTMNGGSITNNTMSGYSGAGVVNCGTVVMNKGLISKNSITDGDGGGAGVHNGPAVLNTNYKKPVFEMRGGEISENTTTTKGSGGGISNLDAICTITSGSICRNQAGNGGGVNNTESVFEMQGGEIIGNRANGYSGGGVNNNTGLATGSFTMSGGVIKENQAAQYGGGVACYEYTTTTGKGVLTISVKNAAVIQNNTLENNKSSNLGLRDNVVLTDVQLKGSNQIGISTETAPKTEKPITIANKTGLMNGLFSDHAAYEIAEEDGKTILQMKKYTVKLVLPEDGSVSKISGGDLVQKVNDNFQAVQLQADDDHYFSEENKSAMRQADIWVSSTSGNVSTITIYVRPTADVEVQILATEKASQEAPGNISGIAPTQEGGKGYLKGVDAKMEYREKGTDTWITCQDNSLGQEVTAGKTYEVRKKGDITKKDSPIIEVFVPNKENVTPDPEPNPNPTPNPEPEPTPTPAPTPEKPVMKDGDNGQYTEGKMETLTFRSSAPLSDFQAVYVDGVIVDRSHYELASGSTIVRLRKEFLDSLAEGIHTLEIRSNGGTATANFKVVKATGSGSNTGSGNTTGAGNTTGSATTPTPSAPTAGITNVQPNGGAQAAQKTSVNAKAPVTGEAIPVSCMVLALIIFGGFALLIAELRKAHKA
ncbi:MAG: hypothetical protein ACLUP2_06205 [Lachnospiraceae bacterium]